MGRQEDSRQEDRQFAKLKIENGYGIIPFTFGTGAKIRIPTSTMYKFSIINFPFPMIIIRACFLLRNFVFLATFIYNFLLHITD
jgi:hypothetical protein